MSILELFLEQLEIFLETSCLCTHHEVFCLQLFLSMFGVLGFQLKPLNPLFSFVRGKGEVYLALFCMCSPVSPAWLLKSLTSLVYGFGAFVKASGFMHVSSLLVH